MEEVSLRFSKILRNWGEKVSANGFSVWFITTLSLETVLLGEEHANGFNAGKFETGKQSSSHADKLSDIQQDKQRTKMFLLH